VLVFSRREKRQRPTDVELQALVARISPRLMRALTRMSGTQQQIMELCAVAIIHGAPDDA
jgi:hypothetical protein